LFDDLAPALTCRACDKNHNTPSLLVLNVFPRGLYGRPPIREGKQTSITEAAGAREEGTLGCYTHRKVTLEA
jgi:hypothetical protein